MAYNPFNSPFKAATDTKRRATQERLLAEARARMGYKAPAAAAETPARAAQQRRLDALNTKKD
jgi:hypothetical protein